MNQPLKRPHRLFWVILLAWSLLPSIHAAQSGQSLQWISPAPGTVLRLNESYPLAATASSGLPVTFELIEGPAILTNNSIQATNAGSVLLRARQGGDEQWYPVSESRLFNPLTVQATEISSILVSERALDIELAGPLAFIANGTQGLHIVDISTPEIPQYIDRVALPGSAARITIQGTLAYVVSIGVGLQVLDISQPTHPVVRGTLPLEGIRPALKVVGQRAYLGDSQRGLVIVDVSDPAHPVQRGSIQTPGPANGIDVADDRVYVAAGTAGLQIYGVSASGSPSRLGGVQFYGEGNDVRVQGTTAMVAAGLGWLRLVDVSNPFAPQLQGTLVTKGYASQIQWVGSKAFVAAASGGLQAVDLLLTEQRRVAAEIPVQKSALGLEVAGQIAFVLTDYYGVRIFRLRDGIRQQLTFTLPPRVSLINPVIPLTATVDSGMPITYTLVNGTATIDGQTLIGTAFSWVVVRAEQSGDSLFLPVQVDAGVTFEREPQTIQFLGPYQVFMTNPTVTLNATSSSGLPVAFRRRIGPGEVNGSILTATQGGTININVYQSGNTIYQPAPQLNVEIPVFRSPQQLEFPLTNRIFLETPVLPLAATSSVGLPVEFRVLSGPGLINGNTLTVTNPGVLVVRAIQPGNAVYEPAQVDREVLVLAASGNGRSLFDPSLQLDLRLSGTVSSLISLPDGSMLAGGRHIGNDERWSVQGSVVHLNRLGDLDTGFPSWRETILTTYPTHTWNNGMQFGKLVLRNTNEVIVSTITRNFSPEPDFRSHVYRTQLDRPEWTFLYSVSNEVSSFGDDKGGIFLAGSTWRPIPNTGGGAYHTFFGRIGADNLWDSRFQIPAGMGPGRNQTFQDVHILQDGRIVVAGSVLWSVSPSWDYQPNTEAFLLSPDGSLMWRYTLDDSRWVTPVKFVAEIPGDRLVLFPSREVLDAATGRRVGRFPIPPDVTAKTTAYFQEPDGRLILAGTFTNYAGIPRRGLAAVLPDGSLDLRFNPGMGTTNGFQAIAREADGSLLLGGDPGTFDGASHRGLIRLYPRNPDYTPPSSAQLQLVPPANPLYECTESSELHVIRTGALNETHRVRIQTEAGTATPGEDFVPIDTELVFAPGERVKSLSLRILGDQPTESLETFVVRAIPESGLTLLGTNVLTFQINDYVCGVAFEYPTFSAVESAGPTGMRVWTAQDPPYGYTTRIRTRDVSARGGLDYVPYDGSPVAGGLPIRFIDNATFEGDRTFIVEAYDSETGLAIPSSKTLEVTIRDDDSLAGPRRGVVGSLYSIVPGPDGWILQGDFTSVDGLGRLDLASVRFDGSVNSAFAPPPNSTAGSSWRLPCPVPGCCWPAFLQGFQTYPPRI